MESLEIIAKDPQIEGTDVAPIISDLVKKDSSLNYDKVSKAVQDWAGRETDILGILMHASEKGMGREYLNRLNQLYETELSQAPVSDGGRQMPTGPVLRTKAKVLGMYQELGVELKEEDAKLMDSYSN